MDKGDEGYDEGYGDWEELVGAALLGTDRRPGGGPHGFAGVLAGRGGRARRTASGRPQTGAGGPGAGARRARPASGASMRRPGSGSPSCWRAAPVRAAAGGGAPPPI